MEEPERVQSEFEQGQETASNRSKSKGCHQNQGNRVPNSVGESYTLLQKWETQPFSPSSGHYECVPSYSAKGGGKE